ISLFYRAWEKYRFYIPYERGEFARPEPDAFTRAVWSLIGVGTTGLRNRLRIATPPPPTWRPSDDGREQRRERVLNRVDDLALIYYGGLFAHRPRSAAGLQALLRDYFQLPVQVRQFQGQWLRLDRDNQSAVGQPGGNNQLNVSLVAGARV